MVIKFENGVIKHVSYKDSKRGERQSLLSRSKRESVLIFLKNFSIHSHVTKHCFDQTSRLNTNEIIPIQKLRRKTTLMQFLQDVCLKKSSGAEYHCVYFKYLGARSASPDTTIHKQF